MNDPLTLAAPAPTPDEDDDVEPSSTADDAWLHSFCEEWSAWCRTRRFYGKPSMPASLLGKLTAKTRATGNFGGPDAIARADLLAFHLAVLGQPAEALDRQVFELHYLWRVKNVKAAAAQVGVGRQHWYTLVKEFRRRAFAASKEILRSNLSGGGGLLPYAAPENNQTVGTQARANTADRIDASSSKVSPPQATQ
jgi:hypothetical protein